MNSEFDSSIHEKDHTKIIWIVVAVAVVIMVALLLTVGRAKPATSQARVRHILLSFDRTDPASRADAFQRAMELRDEIENGASFSKLAKKYSNDPKSSARGGDLGYEKRGVYAPAFDAYVWEAPLHQVSDVIETPYGFHLIEVLDRYVSESDRYEMEMNQKVREREPSLDDVTQETDQTGEDSD